jgi:lipoprotein NlpI
LGKPTDGLKPALAGMKQDWARLLGRFLLGEVEEPELWKAAGAQTNLADRNAFICDTYFYIGQSRLLAGDVIAAKTFFIQAAKGESKLDEYSLAIGELRRL